MKKKKFIAVPMTALLLVTLMTPSSFASDSKDTLPPQTQQVAQEKLLAEKGVKQEELQKLEPFHKSIISNLINAGEVSDSDVKSLVAGFLDRKTDAEKLNQNKIAVNPEYKTLKPRNELLGKPNNEIQLERLQKERGIKNLSELIKPESLTQDPAINDRTNTGALWELRTNAGYSRGTAFVDLPSVSLNKTYDRSAYVFGGLYTSQSGADLGLVTEDPSGTIWYPCMYLGQIGWEGGRLPGEDADGWYQSPTAAINKNVSPRLYLIWSYTEAQNIELEVWNGSYGNWYILSHISMWAPNRNFSTAGTDVKVYQQASIAYEPDGPPIKEGDRYVQYYKGNTSSGSQLNYAHFSKVAVYWNNGSYYRVWDSNVPTVQSLGHGSLAGSKILPYFITPYTESQVSIRFN
ncbi:hypothetical protein [Paenibacillus elgii]|uniref:hypothetical protein n=1 Tax=Paenibacillus elgii TaxID=189691 RepID=UPI000248C840|nr:hypothetical protein [Paenibacillus elgii]